MSTAPITSLDDAHNQRPPVKQMFDGRSVFVTGASGFIGRVLLEKLLRTYAGIKRIYILMRVKRNVPPEERLHQQLLKVPLFDSIRAMENGQQLLDKLVVVAGDIAEPNLGISEEAMQTMVQDESLAVVFHAAATIKFDEPLKVSVKLNLVATKTIIEMCRKLPNLLGVCHVSTAYVNSNMKQNQIIEEKLYPMREDPELLIKLAQIMDEETMQTLKFRFVDERPNTYTYSKALAEHMIAKEAADLPVAIVRPSIVVASWKEPVRGWIDNLNGPTGLILAIGKGLLRTMHTKRNVKADVIPVDVVVNTMIASAYCAALAHGKLMPATSSALELTGASPATSTTSVPDADGQQLDIDSTLKVNGGGDLSEKKQATGGERIPIIQCNSGDLRPVTWGQLEDAIFPVVRQYPSCQVLRYPFGSFKSNKYHDLFVRVFVHYLPALIIDLICIASGKKDIIGKMSSRWQLLSVYSKLHSATAALRHFSTTNYNFESKSLVWLRSLLNEDDARELYMDIENIDWFKFWTDYVLGARRYVLKESDESLPQARRSFRRAYYMEIALRCILITIICYLSLPLLLKLATSGTQNYYLQQLVNRAASLIQIGA